MHATRLLTRRNIIATPKSKSFSNYRKLSFTPRYVPTTTLHTNPSLIRTQVFTREFLGHKKEVVEDKEFGKDIGDGLRVGVRSREQDNVEVYIKLRENLGNELHQAAHNMLSNSKDTVTSLVPTDSVASKVIGAVGTVVGKVVGSTETKEHKPQSRSLWIPLFGTFRLHSNEAGDNEIAFEFNKRKTKGGKIRRLNKILFVS